jgi:hypothetical protein
MLQRCRLQLLDGILADPLVFRSAVQYTDLPGESVLLRISVTFMMKVYTHAVLKHELHVLDLISRVTRKISW